jgi:hypothetical protein
VEKFFSVDMMQIKILIMFVIRLLFDLIIIILLFNYQQKQKKKKKKIKKLDLLDIDNIFSKVIKLQIDSLFLNLLFFQKQI